MENLTVKDVVTRLVGDIQPVGSSNVDDERFENLKVMCELVNNLVYEIDKVQYENKNRSEYSINRAADYADHFLTHTLGISK